MLTLVILLITFVVLSPEALTLVLTTVACRICSQKVRFRVDHLSCKSFAWPMQVRERTWFNESNPRHPRDASRTAPLLDSILSVNILSLLKKAKLPCIIASPLYVT